MPDFTCNTCQQPFNVAQTTLDKFKNWQPKTCLDCKSGEQVKFRGREENLNTTDVLAKYSLGPIDGIFTDGSCDPNPGPGGWGAVYVTNNDIVAQDFGQHPDTTNNRMELTALIEACRMVPPGKTTVVYTDSELCVKTFNEWAHSWAAKGWKKKTGPIKNLDLVQALYATLQQRPEIEIKWIRSHVGNRWNEYADALATAYRRGEKIEKLGEKFDQPLRTLV